MGNKKEKQINDSCFPIVLYIPIDTKKIKVKATLYDNTKCCTELDVYDIHNARQEYLSIDPYESNVRYALTPLFEQFMDKIKNGECTFADWDEYRKEHDEDYF